MKTHNVKTIMTAAIIVFAWACALIFCQEVQTITTDMDSVRERATAWLWQQKDKNNAGWGNDTHIALLALRMAELSDDKKSPSTISMEFQLSSKQAELEIVLMLWRHREIGLSAVRLAKYSLALNVLCKDPRQFYGHDLIGTIEHHEPPADYDFALMTLATCSARAHIRKRQIRRLLDIANVAQIQNVDTIAMVVLALGCITQDHRHQNLHHFVRKPLMSLVQRQRSDGSFGDIDSTALIMQALQQVENQPSNNWNKSNALEWLKMNQQADGSFNGNIRTTAQVILGIIPKSLTSIRTLKCEQDADPSSRAMPNDLDKITKSTNHSKNLTSPSTLVNAVNTVNVESVTVATSDTVKLQQNMVNVSYTLWVGTNETHHQMVVAPVNETFYNVMKLAAKMSPHFAFSASEWPNGHYVDTIAGYKEEPMSYHYWLLYRLASPPNLSSPPGNQLVAPGGVDDLKISQGEHYLFWYKKL